HVSVVEQFGAALLVGLQRIPFELETRTLSLRRHHRKIEHKRLVIIFASVKRFDQSRSIPSKLRAIEQHHRVLRNAPLRTAKLRIEQPRVTHVARPEIANVCEHLHIGIYIHGATSVATKFRNLETAKRESSSGAARRISGRRKARIVDDFEA